MGSTGDQPVRERRAPLTKAARHALITELINSTPVRSQGELAALLAERGVSVTQGTLSRDLVDLGALRVRSSAGPLVYAVPGEPGEQTGPPGEFAHFEARLAKLCTEVLISVEATANLVVMRTPPGAAQYFAFAIDKVSRPDILGTIAGDDTVMVITRDPSGGDAVAEAFRELADRPGS